MKKILYVLCLSILISCNKNKVEYFDTNYEKVIHLAKKHDKMIFLDFSTSWCGGCQIFYNKIIPDSIFTSFMNENFYSAKIDGDHVNNADIKIKYNITTYPTFIITDSKGKEIDRIVGLQENTSGKFIDLINNIFNKKEQLGFFKIEYNKHLDSLELFEKVTRKLLQNDLYSDVREITKFAQKNSQNIEIRTIAKFYSAYACIRDAKMRSPNEMIAFVNEPNNDIQYVEYGMTELFFHYRTLENLDSLRYYIEKLVNMDSQNHFGYVRDYARFLYEHVIDIELADRLTNEYSTKVGNEADHWTPFLKAHSLAQHGKLDEGIKIFDNWMFKYSKPENFKEDYWHYRFYIDLVLFYKKSSNQALEYAKMFEANNPSEYNKKIVAHLYYLNGRNRRSIEKLMEVKAMIENPEKKKKIDELIKKYS